MWSNRATHSSSMKAATACSSTTMIWALRRATIRAFAYWSEVNQLCVQLSYDSSDIEPVSQTSIVRADWWLDGDMYRAEGGYGLADADTLFVAPTMLDAVDYTAIPEDPQNDAFALFDGETWTYYDTDGEIIISGCEPGVAADRGRISVRAAGHAAPLPLQRGAALCRAGRRVGLLRPRGQYGRALRLRGRSPCLQWAGVGAFGWALGRHPHKRGRGVGKWPRPGRNDGQSVQMATGRKAVRWPTDAPPSQRSRNAPQRFLPQQRLFLPFAPIEETGYLPS